VVVQAAAARPRLGPVRTTPMACVAGRAYLGRGGHRHSVGHLPATTGGRCATSRTQRWPASRDPLDVIKTTITVAGFVGAVLVGVYGYRKQRLVEGDARRADAEQLAQRYTTAADQLGHERAAVRLAGVYAMARLADDWDDQRQVCIDVLCAYLRMPYETDPVSEKHREGEQEVRNTIIRIIRIIREHLLDPSASTTWCGRDLHFTNATFDGGGHFHGAKFTGGEVSFHGAKFTGGRVSFHRTEFPGGEISFHRTEFTGGEVLFEDAEFGGSWVLFHDAEFTGGTVSFDNAKFTGGEVVFEGAKLTGGEVSFDDAEFTGSRIAWGPFEPPAAWTELQERERRQDEPPL
jgi:hypothetical protein